MKKIIVGLIRFVLFLLLILLPLNLNIKYMFDDIVSNSGVDEQINKAIDNYFNKEDTNIVSKDEVNEIVDELIDELMEKDEDSDVSDLLTDVINNNRDKLKNYGIDDEKIDNVIYDIEANITSSDSNIKLSEEQKMGLSIYKMVASNKIRIWLITGIIICILLLLIINKINSLKDMGITFISAAALLKGSCIVLDNAINNNDSLKTFKDVKLNHLDKSIYFYVVLGIVLVVGYLIYKNNKKEKV